MSINSLCRLCSFQRDCCVDIYEDNESNVGITSKIETCLQIQIKKDDNLPKMVCNFCLIKVNETFDFYQATHKAQKLLKELRSKAMVQGVECEDPGIRNFSAFTMKYKEMGTDENHEANRNKFQEPQANFSRAIPNLLSSKIRFSNSKNKTSLLVHAKSHRRNKDPDLIDVPVNPRPVGLLNEYPWICTICQDVTMTSMTDLRDHYKNCHQQLPVFKCITCGKQYERYRSFSRHIKLHYDPKKYTCDICGKSFAQRTILQSHATVHTTDKPHECRTCGKKFKNFSSLYVHGKLHLPDRVKETFACEICRKEFSTRHTLDTHKKIHTGERNFICDVCGKSFIAKGSLNYHLLSHTGNKNHVCSTCGKGFKTARLLSKHVSLHTGIKPHQCDVCGKQFRERGALREHSRIHTGVMPYACEYCGKSFRFKGILTVHKRQHTGERPYACLQCRRQFTNWANYNKHMKRIHQRDTSNRENSRARTTVNADPILFDDINAHKTVDAIQIENDQYIAEAQVSLDPIGS